MRASASARPPPRDSYLHIPAILSAAAVTGADAIHPGYGFLSENARFAEMVEAHGITFIGPSPAAYPHDGRQDRRQGGDGLARRAAGAGLGRRASTTSSRPARVAAAIGYPVLIKAAAGGGGRGMKVAAHGRRRSRTPGRIARTEAPRRVRRRLGLPREIPRPAPPHRAAGPRRQPRQRRPFRRARLQPAAPPPEAGRGGRLPRARRRRRATRSARSSPTGCASSATATPARSSSSTRTASSPSSR